MGWGCGDPGWVFSSLLHFTVALVLPQSAFNSQLRLMLLTHICGSLPGIVGVQKVTGANGEDSPRSRMQGLWIGTEIHDNCQWLLWLLQ